MTRRFVIVCSVLLSLVIPAQAQDIQKRTVVLTDSQIAALPTTAVEIVPAPGVGKAIELLQAFVVGNWVVADHYTNVADEGFLSFALWYGDFEYMGSDWGDISPFGNTINKPMWRFLPWVPLGVSVTRTLDLSANYIDNLPIYAMVTNGANGNFTGGNSANTLTITIYYLVVDL